MKLFTCQRCHQIVFFESVACTRCGATLAYLEDRRVVAAIQPVGEPAPDRRWTLLEPPAGPQKGAAAYRLCRNSTDHEVCNWAVPADSGDEYCLPCRLNHVIPNLSDPAAAQAWHRLEIAKRRVIYTLLHLELPVEPRATKPTRGAWGSTS